jgi:succinyl-CoA synthetase beta subunit
MKLKEYQGKELFKNKGISIPENFLVRDSKDFNQDNLSHIKTDEVIVKAQVLSGKRKKSGLIVCVLKKDTKETAKFIFNKGVDEILIEEELDIQKEVYLSITIDRFSKSYCLLFSEEGGIDIEELSEKQPEKVIKIPFYEIDEELLSKLNEKINNQFVREQVNDIIKKLFSLMKEIDGELVEINPLILTKDNKLIAADAKVIIDDNSLFRHEEYISMKQQNLTDTEKKASEHGLNYVDLDGDIGIIGNGAGLVMSTLDVINHFGGSAANFLDVGGGASVEKMEKSLELILSKNIKGIFINIFGGITRCDEIAQGIVNHVKNNQIKVPIVIRMIGTNEDKAKEILEQNNISFIDSMEEGVKKIVEQITKT